jgi:hypothetical protein
MKSFSKVMMIASCGLISLSVGCAEMQMGSPERTDDASPATTKAAISAVDTGPNRVSQGTQGDTLQACLARIPKDATDSQRMLATLTCERDEKARASIDAVPGR